MFSFALPTTSLYALVLAFKIKKTLGTSPWKGKLTFPTDTSPDCLSHAGMHVRRGSQQLILPWGVLTSMPGAI